MVSQITEFESSIVMTPDHNEHECVEYYSKLALDWAIYVVDGAGFATSSQCEPVVVRVNRFALLNAIA